jgi:hypothetical protein
MSGLSRDRAESCRGFVPEFETLRRADAVAFDHLQVAMDIIGGPMGNEVQGPGVRPGAAPIDVVSSSSHAIAIQTCKCNARAGESDSGSYFHG